MIADQQETPKNKYATEYKVYDMQSHIHIRGVIKGGIDQSLHNILYIQEN